MSRQQSTVIWLGLILVTFNLIIHWAEIKTVIFGTPAGSSSTSSGTNQPEGNTVNNPSQTGGKVPTPTPNPSPTPASIQVNNQPTAV